MKLPIERQKKRKNECRKNIEKFREKHRGFGRMSPLARDEKSKFPIS